eukprot:4532202-Prymnesium_polylepis.1
MRLCRRRVRPRPRPGGRTPPRSSRASARIASPATCRATWPASSCVPRCRSSSTLRAAARSCHPASRSQRERTRRRHQR